MSEEVTLSISMINGVSEMNGVNQMNGVSGASEANQVGQGDQNPACTDR